MGLIVEFPCPPLVIPPDPELLSLDNAIPLIEAFLLYFAGVAPFHQRAQILAGKLPEAREFVDNYHSMAEKTTAI